MSQGEIHEVTAWHYRTRQAVCVRWAAHRILSLEPTDAAPEHLWIAPPLFDLQVNGYAGIDFQQLNLTVEALLAAVRGLRAAGCTRFLLTLITDEWARLLERLERLRGLRAASAELTAAIAGWHIEGPFLSPLPGFCGTHNPAYMRDPTPADIEDLYRVTDGDPVLLTLAPERAGAFDTIKAAVARGFTVSLGHTDASVEVLREASACGARAFTHLANGCPVDLNRHDNILWRVIDQPELTVSLIPDGIHVTPALFRLLHRAMQPGRIFYITDAMAAAGAPPGRYQLGNLEVEVGADQVVRRPGSPYLSGSALRPLDGVFRAARTLNAPWQDAWRRFSEIPASLMGLQNQLAPGAEFCLVRATPDSELLECEPG